MFSICSVLIVDDDSFARGIIRHHLRRLGIKNIFEADDGEQALATLRSAKMQLVIADRYMPTLNGLELFCGMQTDPDLKDTPFIMITMCLAPPGWVDLRASRLYDAATYLKEQLICR